MNSFAILTFILASATVIHAQDNVIEKYLEYLMPFVEPCATEQKLTGEDLQNIQKMTPGSTESDKLGCLRACVMKGMNVLVNNKIELGPLHTMIETVHAGNADAIENGKNIAAACATDVEGETEECQLGTRYADCYIKKMMGGA